MKRDSPVVPARTAAAADPAGSAPGEEPSDAEVIRRSGGEPERFAEASGTARPPAATLAGLASNGPQLVAYAVRAAAAGPAFDPQPRQWIYVRTLQAASSAGEGGFLFGPPDKRVISAGWTRVDNKLAAHLRHGQLELRHRAAGRGCARGRQPALTGRADRPRHSPHLARPHMGRARCWPHSASVRTLVSSLSPWH